MALEAMTPADEALAKSESRFRSLIEHSTDLIFVINGDGRLVYGSPSGTRVLGYDPDDLIGMDLIDLVHPDDAENVVDQLTNAAARRGISPAVTFRAKVADGGWRWIEAVGNNLLETPEVGGLVVNARDITQQHEASVSVDRLNRLMRTLSAADAALIHADSEESLLNEVCRVIVEIGGFSMAAIAAPSHNEGGRIVLLASYGDPTFVTRAVEMSNDSEMSGPLIDAVRTNRRAVIHDSELMAPDLPGRRLAEEFGYRSALALPLDSGRGPLGSLLAFSKGPNAFDINNMGVLVQLAGDLAFGIDALRTRAERQHYLDQLERTLRSVVDSFAATVELRDPYTAGHQRRVAQLAAAIAEAMGLDTATVDGIETAASIHDIGKIAVPAEILSTPSRLNVPQYEIIKEHSLAGYELVKAVEFQAPVADMILQHHERMDGSGYPCGLRGSEILLGARIIAVADVVEAMASHRPYRPGLGLSVALEEIRVGSGQKYDPDVAATCIRLFEEDRFAWTSA